MGLTITNGKQNEPYAVVIHGQEGVGKSTLAKDFPGALFMDVEGSTARMDVHRLPVPQSWAQIQQQIGELRKSPPKAYKTLIIDTWDWALQLAAKHVIASKPKDDGSPRDSIESFGYGRGYTYIAEECGRMLDMLNDLRYSARWNIVLLCHTALRKFELPEEEGSFDRWEMKIERRPNGGMSAFSLTKEWPDLLLFARYKTIVETNDAGKKKAHGQKRVFQTEHSAVWDAKNRDGLKPELPLEFASIAHLFQGSKATTVDKPAGPVPTTQKADDLPVDETPQATTGTVRKSISQLQALADAADLTIPEIMAACTKFFPAGTPIENVPDEFIQGKMIPLFKSLAEKAKQIKDAANAN